MITLAPGGSFRCRTQQHLGWRREREIDWLWLNLIQCELDDAVSCTSEWMLAWLPKLRHLLPWCHQRILTFSLETTSTRGGGGGWALKCDNTVRDLCLVPLCQSVIAELPRQFIFSPGKNLSAHKWRFSVFSFTYWTWIKYILTEVFRRETLPQMYINL